MQVLLDADLLLDIVLNRIEGRENSDGLWNALLQQTVRGYLTIPGLDKIHWAIRARKDQVTASRVDQSIRSMIELCPIDQRITQLADQLSIQDLESAVEVACALYCNIGAIVTHRPEMFEGAPLHILSINKLLHRLGWETRLATDKLTSVNLSQWFNGTCSSEWQPTEKLLGQRQSSFQFRSSNNSLCRGKLLSLASGEHLVLTLKANRIVSGMNIWAEVWALEHQTYLPNNLKVEVLNQAGEVVMTAHPNNHECARLNFITDLGETFSLRVISGATCITEGFIT